MGLVLVGDAIPPQVPTSTRISASPWPVPTNSNISPFPNTTRQRHYVLCACEVLTHSLCVLVPCVRTGSDTTVLGSCVLAFIMVLARLASP